ncbi:MAG: hypothetical protein PHW95_00770 [Patescibacteria group bacterium]|nr:hypothetical protein [Patescibacteria group bacterium]
MNKYLLKFASIIFIILFIATISYLIFENFSFFSAQKIVLSTSDQPMMTKLGPAVRVTNNDGVQNILAGPVYFDLRSMPWFTQATVYLTFKSAGINLENMAYQTGPGFQYQTVEPLLVEAIGDGWTKATFSFEMSKIYQKRNVRRFLISVSPSDENHIKSLILKELTIYLNK